MSSLTDKVPEFTQPIYIPDIPAQMNNDVEDVITNDLPEELKDDVLIEQKESELVIEPAKKTRKKKED